MVVVNVTNTEVVVELEFIKTFNPWWTNSAFRFPEKGIVKRLVIDELDKYFNVPQIISILGLRRAGKTTILKQYVNKLLDNKVSPDNIIFFSFEDYLGKSEPEILEKLINTYLQRFLQKDIWKINEQVYLFLDEVQYIEHWQDIVKRFYDINQNLKFIISGSFSAVIKKSSSESLAGRVFEVVVPLFSFYEFCLLKDVKINFSPIPIKTVPHLSKEKLDEISRVNELYSNEINQLYEEYLFKGQFPETLIFQDESMVISYIKGSVLKKILTEDAPRIFKIDKVGEFSGLYRIISKETGNLFELLNLAREIGINKDTLNNYIYYLEHLFIVKLIYNYTKKLRRQYRIQKKIYILSPNFTCNEHNINNNSPYFSKIAGSLVETAVFQLLYQSCFEVFFWRERQKEIDFIIEQDKTIVPIEVKYAKKITPKDHHNLIYFMNKNKLKLGIIITKNKTGISNTEDNGKIIYIPSWALV